MSQQAIRPGESGATLRQALAQREAELTIINSIQQGLASHLDVQSIYDLVGDEIRDFTGAQVVMISTYDRETDTLEHRYAIERGERVYAPGNHPCRGFRTQIVQTRQPILVNRDVAAQAALLGQPTLPGTITPKSWLGVPMLVGDEVAGILSLQDVEREDAYSEADVRLLQTLASSMTIALENARLFEQTERLLRESEQRAAQLQIINSVQEGLAHKLDAASIYELVGERFRQTFPQADLSIVAYDPATDVISGPFIVEDCQRLAFEPFKLGGKGIVAYLLSHPQPLVINENMAEVVAQYQGVDATGTGLAKSAIYVPLVVGEAVRGAIVLEDKAREHAFSTSDIRLLDTLSNSMSVALENARLWEQEDRARKALVREFEIGREIQTSFLPDSIPQPVGWEIAASLESAREVAGDFYDVFSLSRGRLGLVIADVCDKGLGAALFMTLFRTLIRAATGMKSLAHLEPAGRVSIAVRISNAISLTNNYVAETHGQTNMFATVFLGILDTESGILTYANGGHLPPLLISHCGDIKETLRITGPAVGITRHASYTTCETMIDVGDTLFAYTDGLTDAADDAGIPLNENDLMPYFADQGTLSSLLARVKGHVEVHCSGAPPADDITMLAVRRNGGSAR